MSLLSRIARMLPPAIVTWLGRLQYQLPFLRPLVQRAADGVRNAPAIIPHGVAAGLRFNPHGGNPGYALGTSGKDEQEALQRYLAPGKVFYDIGANKGFYVVVGARLVGTAGHVYAFEPFPGNVEAINDNVAQNGFENVTVFEAAISDATTKGELVLVGDSVEFKLASSRNASVASDDELLSVDVYSIDDLIRKELLRPPDLVMIDVEGAEVEVLKGMVQTIKDHRPIILCEVHWLRNEIRTLVDEVFKPLGYLATTLDGSALPDDVTRYHLLMQPAPR